MLPHIFVIFSIAAAFLFAVNWISSDEDDPSPFDAGLFLGSMFYFFIPMVVGLFAFVVVVSLYEIDETNLPALIVSYIFLFFVGPANTWYLKKERQNTRTHNAVLRWIRESTVAGTLDPSWKDLFV